MPMTDPTAPKRAWQDIIDSEQWHSDTVTIQSVLFGNLASHFPGQPYFAVEDNEWMKTHSGEWHQDTFAEAPATNVAKPNGRTESD